MKNYQLWITNNNGTFEKYVFNTMREAYIYYLNHFATKEDFEYYKECSGKNLFDVANDDEVIKCMFRNVFNAKHHLYEAIDDNVI